MTSIDELFKGSGLAGKRRLDPVRDPNEIYKSAKLSGSSSSRHAQVQDDDDNDIEAGPRPPAPGDDDDDDNGDYGPSAPPEDDPDDEEGRFFGGGISRQEAAVLDFVESADAERAADAADDRFDAAWLRRTALALEKKINRNAELRAKHAADPARFMDSEAELDAAVRELSIVTEHPELYPEFARLGTADSLAELLAHDNTDVALAAVQIMGELTGDDVEGATEAQWAALVHALLEADLMQLLVSNLDRLDEADEADREGVYRILELVENLCSRPATAEVVGRHDPLLRWLLTRAAKAEDPVTQNKQYAAEMLAILAQAGPANRERLAAAADVVEPLLQLVAPYRARDPARGDEEEFMQNCFEALTGIVDCGPGKAKFVDAEGFALCLVLMSSPTAKKCKMPALRLLDHAVGQSREFAMCERIVEHGGLKTLFTLFMRSSSVGGGAKKKRDPAAVEHLVSIFAWMLRLLPADGAERIRTLAKFVEKDYEKTERLVALRREYAARVAAVDAELDDDHDGVHDPDLRFSRRLDAGLFVLQSIDVILAWLAAEDSGARRKIEALLADRDETLELIRSSLREQAEAVDVETEDGKEMVDMLNTLAEMLE